MVPVDWLEIQPFVNTVSIKLVGVDRRAVAPNKVTFQIERRMLT